MQPSDPSSDFDTWMSLAQTDPVAFEERRSRLIEEFIERTPADQQRRLRGLQFKVDMERRRARTPMAACLRISDMMWQAVVGEGGLRDTLNSLGATCIARSTPRHSGMARVIHFRKPSEP
jgi:hypothetical protein